MPVAASAQVCVLPRLAEFLRLGQVLLTLQLLTPRHPPALHALDADRRRLAGPLRRLHHLETRKQRVLRVMFLGKPCRGFV